MRVILANRSTSQRILAGDSVQQFKTAEALRQIGITVETAEGKLPDLNGVELIHIFNVIPIDESYDLFQQAKSRGLPVVLSPIYWDPQEFLSRTYAESNSEFQHWWADTDERRRKLLQGADILLPNGQAELDLIQKAYQPLPLARIVPNAADSLYYLARPDRFHQKFGLDRFILCVGRISRRKNQLGLIRALKRHSFQLVFIGPINDYPYYRECRAESTRCRVRFVESLPPVELASAYAAADLHVLPSWYETPGLVSLEAALANCKVVSTDRGTAREYLGEEALYCDPGDPNSIRSAVLSALTHPGFPKLRQRILQEYNWERVARLTLSAYQFLLNS